MSTNQKITNGPIALERWRGSSAFHGDNALFVEALYERYLCDPHAIDPVWRQHFDALRSAPRAAAEVAHGPIRARFVGFAQASGHGRAVSVAPAKQAAVLRLIEAYRARGHQLANLDPLRLQPAPRVPDLEPDAHHLETADLDRAFHTGSLYGPERMTLRDLLALLRRTYCGTVGAEYLHITTTREKRWIQKRIETYQARPELSAADRRWLLTLLTAAEGLEKYLHTRYVGQKRFSLEGAEALIPLLDELIQRAGRRGLREIVIGMAHRGRLNVLTNILGKPPQDIFAEFEGRAPSAGARFAGDVKYHLGFATDVETPGGFMHVALGFNPSHLEIVAPVIEGAVRARQRRRGDHDGGQVLPVLIHGDSAFAGQGVVMETLQLSQTRGFATGGTVHIIVNNQIGFTTSNPLDIRSTLYCTDVAKMVQGPVFHVNADDPEAVIFVTRLALDFRHEFRRDVFIDLVCYRRLGHNEADEPAVTQPLMYRKIHAHPTARALYAQHLIKTGVLDAAAVAALVTDYRRSIEQGVAVARPVLCALDRAYRVDWRRFASAGAEAPVDTRVPLATLRALGSTHGSWPATTTAPAAFSSTATVSSNRAKRSLAASLPPTVKVVAEQFTRTWATSCTATARAWWSSRACSMSGWGWRWACAG